MLKNMNKSGKIIFVFLLLLSVFLLNGCSGNGLITFKYKVAGKVIDEQTVPVENAMITLNNTVDFTDSDGRFEFYVPAGNNYILEVTKGQNRNVKEIDVTEDKEDLIIVLADLGSATVKGTVKVYNRTSSDYYVSSSSLDKTRDIKPYSVDSKPDYVKGELLIKYSDKLTINSISSLETEKTIQEISSIDTDRGKIVRYQIPAGKTVEDMIEYYSDKPGVEWVTPNHLRYASIIPNDPEYGYEIYKQWGHIAVNLEAAWDEEQGNDIIKVAVIDTGVLTEHPDLNSRLTSGVDFVGESDIDDPGNPSDYQPTDYSPVDEAPDFSHGTHVAGIVGAETDNTQGIAGINWDVDIMPIRVMDSGGTGCVYDECEGIYYAIDNNADIINLSLGSCQPNPMEEEAIEAAINNNIIVVAATGNGDDNNDALPAVDYPAAYPGVIGVGAVYRDMDDEISWVYFSNYGYGVDIVAPGANILSTAGYYDNVFGQVTEYSLQDGTSMATAYVSGAAALLLADGVSKSSVYSRLVNSTVDLNTPGWDEKTGYGLLDTYGALLNKKLNPPKIFAGEEFGEDIYLNSEFTEAEEDGNYELDQVKDGYSYIYGWRDVDGDGMINKGDYFGRTESEIYLSKYDNEYNVNFDIYYISDETNKLGSLSPEKSNEE